MTPQTSADPGTQATITTGDHDVKDISGFSVSIDILQMGDPFSLTVPNPRGKWTNKLTCGSKATLKMANPNVNRGNPALMHTGRLVGRELTCEIGTGSLMQLQCADLGWHLMNHYPKPHERLEEKSFDDLLTWATREPTWEIEGVSDDAETARIIRLGLSGGRASAEAEASNNLIVFQAQVEPGMSLGDLLITYAKRFNRLVNMSPDGFITIFQPNYTQAPRYRIDLHEYDAPANVRNNVLAAALSEDITRKWTKVTCVGQIVGYSVYDPWGYNPGKFLGESEDVGADKLPFRHEFTYADGEVWIPKMNGIDIAALAAGWRMKRDRLDCWEARYKVRGHWQSYGGQANWYVPDTMVEVRDDVLGIQGNYYCSAVKLERTREGDTTELTLKKPNLLSANYADMVTRSFT